MENMRERMARGDIKQERAEAIKVRSHLATQYITQADEHVRQCAILLQTERSNFKHHKCTYIPSSRPCPML
jgi:hypothetical protein